jgi:hypothetical protein
MDVVVPPSPPGATKMRTQGCRLPVVVLMVVPALFLLQACGGGSGGGTPVGTVPTIVSISPPSAAAGATSLTLTVTGTSFLSGATVYWNGASLPTTVVSATELTATVAGSQLATGATVTITAVNPGSGGGTSSPLLRFPQVIDSPPLPQQMPFTSVYSNVRESTPGVEAFWRRRECSFGCENEGRTRAGRPSRTFEFQPRREGQSFGAGSANRVMPRNRVTMIADARKLRLVVTICALCRLREGAAC